MAKPIKVFVNLATDGQLRAFEEKTRATSQGSHTNIQPSLRQLRFLHLAPPTQTISDLKTALTNHYNQIDPNPQPIVGILESHFCLVPQEYRVEDVFEPESEVYIVIGNSKKRPLASTERSSDVNTTPTAKKTKFQEKRNQKKANRQLGRATPPVSSLPDQVKEKHTIEPETKEPESKRTESKSDIVTPFNLFGPNRVTETGHVSKMDPVEAVAPTEESNATKLQPQQNQVPSSPTPKQSHKSDLPPDAGENLAKKGLELAESTKPVRNAKPRANAKKQSGVQNVPTASSEEPKSQAKPAAAKPRTRKTNGNTTASNGKEESDGTQPVAEITAEKPPDAPTVQNSNGKGLTSQKLPSKAPPKEAMIESSLGSPAETSVNQEANKEQSTDNIQDDLVVVDKKKGENKSDSDEEIDSDKSDSDDSQPRRRVVTAPSRKKTAPKQTQPKRKPAAKVSMSQPTIETDKEEVEPALPLTQPQEFLGLTSLSQLDFRSVPAVHESTKPNFNGRNDNAKATSVEEDEEGESSDSSSSGSGSDSNSEGEPDANGSIVKRRKSNGRLLRGLLKH